MDTLRVASILVAIVIIAGIAYTLQQGGGGEVVKESTTTSTATTTPVEETQAKATHTSTTQTTSKTTKTTRTTITREPYTTTTTTHENTETETRQEASEATHTKTSKEHGEGITPLPPPGTTHTMKQDENARTIKIERVFKGENGWVKVKGLSISYDEDRGVLNITIQLSTPDPCWKVKVDLNAENKTAQVTLIATRNPQDICVMMVKDTTVTAAGPAREMPTTIILKIVVDGSVEEIPINIGEEYTGK
ncbi:MAG: hypothetical protein GSR86_01845 [Desulfurococcales archaeon]|nr:hypothetical protein [Desulfurococcales archaeon]